MIRLYSFHTAPSALLTYQREMFARFMDEDHELVVVNDGRGATEAAVIAQAATTLGLRSAPVPAPEHNNPSDALAAAMEFVVARLLGDDEEISVLLHADVLPGARFSLRELLGEGDIAAVAERKYSPDGQRMLSYPWSGFICLRTPTLPDRATIGFGAGVIDGIACDTGGAFRRYRRSHPELRLVELSSAADLDERESADRLPDLGMPYPQGRGPQRFAGVLLHYLGGAGWNPDDAPHEPAKRKWFTALCDGLLTGEVALPSSPQPATAAWPADTP
ncbi:MAG TPA: hypothetical protein VGG41_18655 [Solirubrobacteraceae bacterium]